MGDQSIVVPQTTEGTKITCVYIVSTDLEFENASVIFTWNKALRALDRATYLYLSLPSVERN
jgi:hypothetical protein